MHAAALKNINIIGLSYSGGSIGHNIGCEKFLDHLIDNRPSLFTNETGQPTNFKIVQNIFVPTNIDCLEAHRKISEELHDIARHNNNLYIGGDHSVTVPALRHTLEYVRDIGDNSFALLILDAHADVCSYNEPTHEDWLRYMIERGEIIDRDTFIFGLRDVEQREFEYLRTKEIKTYFMREIFEKGIKKTTDTLIKQLGSYRDIYCSIDIDVIDPSAAPATGYPSPGGLSSREALYLVQKIKLLGQLRGIDLVEVNPSFDNNGITVQLARKLLAEIL